MSDAISRLRAEAEHGTRFGNTSVVVALVDLVEVLAGIPTVEYMPVLVCTEHSPCIKWNDSEDGRHEHVLTGSGKVFTTTREALEHAAGMKAKVYGPEHDIVIRTRQVTEWRAEQ